MIRIVLRRKASVLLCLSLLALLLSVPVAHAQWKKIAYHLYDPSGAGVIAYRQGFLWVASNGLYMSSDLGATWTTMNFPDPAMNGILYDLNFFDANTGLAAGPGGTYLTNDQGITWTLVKPGLPLSACFGLTKNIIATAEEQPGGVNISTDGGTTWQTTLTGYFGFKIRGLRDGSFYAYSGIPYSRGFPDRLNFGHLYTTSDYGITWTKHAGMAEYDSYDFDVDSCELNRVYLASANQFGSKDDSSRIYVSQDTGTSWKRPITTPGRFFSGTLALSTNAVYAQTVVTTDSAGFPHPNGIYRTIDKGLSWKAIGGPSNDRDTRFLASITDNIIIAGDEFGNVWGTKNSGGDSIVSKAFGSYTFFPDSLLRFDTLASCGPAQSKTALLIRHCAAAPIASMNIAGKDSQQFLLVKGKNQDSVAIVFTAGDGGQSQAMLQLDLADGTSDTLLLAGYSRRIPNVVLKLADASTDTIGGTVFVPIMLDSALVKSDLSFVLRFDTTILIYDGAFVSGDTSSNMTITQEPGFSRIRIPANRIDWNTSVIGYLAFRVFPTTVTCSRISLDSIAIKQNEFVCQQSVNAPTAQICSKGGCNTTILSQKVRYGTMPTLAVLPNPSKGLVTITSSNDLGMCRLTIVDERGIECRTAAAVLTPDKPIIIDCAGLTSGAYTIGVVGANYSATLSMLHIK